MKHILNLGLYLVLLGGLAACQTEPQEVDFTTDEPFISANDASELIGQPDVIFLHIGQNPDEFSGEHIEGARFLALGAFTETRDGVPFEVPSVEDLQNTLGEHGIDGDSRVIIYSDPSLGDIEALAAARAFFTLEALGHPYVQILDGGLPAWRNAGLELVDGETIFDPVAYSATSDPQSLIVSAADIADNLDTPAVILIDARPSAEYSGETPGMDIERPGHIPGAQNLFWKDFLQEDGTLRPINELEDMWAESGIIDDQEIVVYCRTGMQASYAYLVARHLGYVPHMYDGSYIDWSNNTDYPISTN